MVAIELCWEHEHGQVPVRVETPAVLERTLGNLLEQRDHPFVVQVALADDHRPVMLDVGLDPADGVGVVYYAGPAGSGYSKGTQKGHHALYYDYMGEGTAFPPDSEVPVELVVAAVLQYMDTGGARPTAVRWQEWDELEGSDLPV